MQRTIQETNIQENNSKDVIALEKTVRLINTLPDDVMRHIYEEYFIGIEACNKYLELLKSSEAQSLIYNKLVDPTRRLLEYPCAVEYLCSKHPIFKQMYIEHYVKNNKYFAQMNVLESFIVSILMHLYH